MSKPRPLLTLIATASVLLSAALALPPAAAAGFGDRTLREGMRGADVAALQRKLTRLGVSTPVDRVFGRETERSMKRYERRSDRRVNGVCSRTDARYIEQQLGKQPDAGADGETGGAGSIAYGSRPIAIGDSGSDVEQLQRYLRRLGLPTRIDGDYSDGTRRNVKDWEAWRYKRVNGRVGTEEATAIRKQAQNGARYVERKHVIHGDDGSDSVYMHLLRRGVVRPGERVRAGEMIAKVGSSGASSGPHLHFELWTHHWFDGGKAYDPLPDLRRWDEQT